MTCYDDYMTYPLQALEGLLEGMNPPPSDPDMFVSFRDCHILILRALQVIITATYIVSFRWGVRGVLFINSDYITSCQDLKFFLLQELMSSETLKEHLEMQYTDFLIVCLHGLRTCDIILKVQVCMGGREGITQNLAPSFLEVRLLISTAHQPCTSPYPKGSKIQHSSPLKEGLTCIC